MNKLVKPGRMATGVLLLAALLIIYLSSLYELQIIEGEKYYETSQNSIVTTQTVSAARGDITDRYGRVLVSSRACYNITIDIEKLRDGDDPNGVILRLVRAADEAGVKHSDTMPISAYPYEYDEDMDSTQRSRLDTYIETYELGEDISAARLMGYMQDSYNISRQYNNDDLRTIAGIRYELDTRWITNAPTYVFAGDVDVSLITVIEEGDFPGVVIETSSVREYHTTYAAHLLGYVGAMGPEEYETYKEAGYPMDAVVGKDGAELAFEEYLHGTDGTVRVTSNTEGVVTGMSYTDEPKPGSNVALTIDIGLQAAAEDALAETIQNINAARTSGMEKAQGGAAVVVDVNSFEVLACASYPTYDLATFRQNADALAEDKLLPMWNRALWGTYSPGSTFKMATGLAAMQEEIISPYAEIYDQGKITVYNDYQPVCWVYPGSHGYLNVMDAIENSCNYFFYLMGYELGIDKLAYYAGELGLGQKTGIELGEDAGLLASAEEREERGEVWYGGDNMQAAIGQSDHLFTPIQLACYTATLANGGTRYTSHILNSVYSSDYSATLLENQPVVSHIADINTDYFEYIRRGMLAVSQKGTASAVLAEYPVEVGAKTGTVQIVEGGANTAVFVCFAPYDDPEIAIAVVIEKGGSGSSIIGIAKEIMDYYFADDSSQNAVLGENVLIP